MTHIPGSLRRLVWDRAQGRCEYCLFPDGVAYFPHEVDHVVAEKHGGQTIESNLCLSCWVCNRHKGSDLSSIDPQTGSLVALFDPRRDSWEAHFSFDGAEITGLTPKGRATARMLRFNDPDQIELRAVLVALDEYPR